MKRTTHAPGRLVAALVVVLVAAGPGGTVSAERAPARPPPSPPAAEPEPGAEGQGEEGGGEAAGEEAPPEGTAGAEGGEAEAPPARPPEGASGEAPAEGSGVEGEGAPAEGSGVEGEGAPAEGEPAEGAPAEGEPAEGAPAEGEPAAPPQPAEAPPPVREAPSPYAAQLAADTRPIPEGMGALFVPALTDPTLEPSVDVFEHGSLVATSPMAEQVFLPPGRYTIRVGRGNQRVRPFVEVEVREGEVSIAEPTWAALVIDVVDERDIPHRGSYDLIRLDTREPVGTGRGADRRTGEGLRTWLLIPGTYKIVRPGGTYRERTDFVTVRVDGGEVTHFLLVVDPGTGVFRGGGVQDEGDRRTTVGGLELRGALGGSVEFTHRYQVPDSDDGVFIGGDLFLDMDMLYDRGLSFFSLQLQVEAGARYDFRDDWRKTLDFLDLAAIYILQVHRLVGPYVRASYNTHMMPVFTYFEDPTDVLLLAVDGTEDRRLGDVTAVELGPVFALHDIRQGIGVNARPVRSYWIDLDLRLGVGFQQLVARDLYVADDDPDTDEEEFGRLETLTHREGIEAGLVAAGSLTGWLSYTLELGVLEPFLDLENPVVELDVMLTLRLWSFASLNYLLRLRYDVAIVDEAQVNQAVLLRFAWNLF